MNQTRAKARTFTAFVCNCIIINRYNDYAGLENEMERFIIAVSSSNDTKYYLPEEITSQMYGRKIRIVGGPLDGYEGNLITTRGSKVKRLMIKLQDFFAAGVEVNPEYIQLI